MHQYCSYQSARGSENHISPSDAESELRSLSDLEEKLGEVIFPFDEVVPDITKEWLRVYSTSCGRAQELLLISALTSTSALIGKTTVKVFGTYEEPGNLFMIAVAPSGSGKTPACHLGCTGPIVGHIESKINTNILIDITSANGLFNHFYSLSANAREAFFKFSKPPEIVTPSQSSAGTRPKPEVKHSNSKRNKQVIRLAVNMHVLYERLKKALAHQTGPTERTISLSPINMAINLVETLETYKGISETDLGRISTISRLRIWGDFPSFRHSVIPCFRF
ncbi:uncharacterized protein [Montipora capricornis]|uniref:uncharacterized protein n=1 Tax=Montipora capricornis TaxID=246305 RepID=UPI0035F15E53